MAGRLIIDTAQIMAFCGSPVYSDGSFVNKGGYQGNFTGFLMFFWGISRADLWWPQSWLVGFAAICGSSLATAVTMSKVALPEMRKYGYSDELCTASIAAGGTLGILIPPVSSWLSMVCLPKHRLELLSPVWYRLINFSSSCSSFIVMQFQSGTCRRSFSWKERFDA